MVCPRTEFAKLISIPLSHSRAGLQPSRLAAPLSTVQRTGTITTAVTKQTTPKSNKKANAIVPHFQDKAVFLRGIISPIRGNNQDVQRQSTTKAITIKTALVKEGNLATT
jgi:hypothetical protein